MHWRGITQLLIPGRLSSEGLQQKLIRQICTRLDLDNHSKFDTQPDFVQTLYHVIELVKEKFKQNIWRIHGT